MLLSIIINLILVAIAAFLFVNIISFISNYLFERRQKKNKMLYDSLTEKEKEILTNIQRDIMKEFKNGE